MSAPPALPGERGRAPGARTRRLKQSGRRVPIQAGRGYLRSRGRRRRQRGSVRPSGSGTERRRRRPGDRRLRRRLRQRRGEHVRRRRRFPAGRLRRLQARRRRVAGDVRHSRPMRPLARGVGAGGADRERQRDRREKNRMSHIDPASPMLRVFYHNRGRGRRAAFSGAVRKSRFSRPRHARNRARKGDRVKAAGRRQPVPLPRSDTISARIFTLICKWGLLVTLVATYSSA
jgi:hypothetical protein